MKMRTRVCYHGTNQENAQSIIKTGFRLGTWFAANLQDALAYGGPHVFQVVFHFEEPPNWQFMVDEEVSTDRIVQYSVFEQRIIVENDTLR